MTRSEAIEEAAREVLECTDLSGYFGHNHLVKSEALRAALALPQETALRPLDVGEVAQIIYDHICDSLSFCFRDCEDIAAALAARFGGAPGAERRDGRGEHGGAQPTAR